MQTRIYLVRHGQTAWNLETRCQGHTDIPLDQAGRQQADRLAEELRSLPFQAVYSSDLIRARETAERLARPHGLGVVTMRELRERYMGTWEGLTSDERRHRWPALISNWAQGERDSSELDSLKIEYFEHLQERMLRALADIAGRHPGGDVLVVSHGGAIVCALESAGLCGEDRWRYAGNCGVAPLVTADGRTWSVDDSLLPSRQASA